MADSNIDLSDGARTQTVSGWRSWITFGWIRSPLGLLKIAEFFVLLLALIIVSTIDFGSISSIEFFMFIHTTAWVFVLVHIILYILNVYHRLPAIIRSNIVMLVCCGVASLMLLICSSVIIGKARDNDTTLAAGSFGLIAMFMFLFETVYYLIQCRSQGGFPSNTNSGSQNQLEEPTDY